ncbi:uncharacterized protein [Apostichopus japonicus]|uniref:uncharacterized protein n=1 Tax=Stichopus japonicus TaxID=307972 RepID=UPI003AB42DE9
MNANTFKMLWVMIILSSVLVGGFSDTCPSIQFIEIMGTNKIRCDDHAEINRYYWYVGSTSETDPILKLVNGKMGGSKYNDGHYDITPNGDMTIKNAQLEHEAIYTFVAFFTNDSVWTRDISVIITNTPTHLCPQIRACAECEKCKVILPENETANLTCFIEGVRPQPVMYWTYEGVANVTKNESHSELTNHTRDTWTVSTIIFYEMPCGETTVFNCYIYSDGWLLNVSLTAKVEVNSERCHAMSTETPSNVPKKGCFKLDLIPCIFIWVIIVAIICIVIYICLTRSYTTSRKRKVCADPLKDELIKYYLTKFNAFAESTYATCDCVIRTSEEDAETATSDDILKESFFNNSDCVIFTGKVGYGKTYLFQHVARLWAKGEILQNAIVIYIKLKPFCKKACILEEVVKSMDGQFQSVEAISNILQERECLLLLDGLTNLTLENKDLEKGSKSDTQSKTNSLPADIYKLSNLDNFKKLKVWVTCRQLNTIEFSRRYKKVILKGFNEDQRKTLLQQMVKLNVNEFEETKDSGEESRLLSQDSTLPESIDVITECPLVFYAFALNYLIPKYQNKLQAKTDSTIMIANLMGSLLHNDNNQIHLSHTKHFQLLWALFELCKDEEKSKQIRNIFEGKDLLFTNVNDEDNMSLVKDVCTRYMGANITVSTLTFRDGYPPSLDSCKLPNVEKELTFQNVRLEDKQFTSLIRRFSTQTITINCINSVVPQTVSEDQLNLIRQTSEGEIKLTINRKQDEEAFNLHFEEGNWIKSKQDETTSLVQSTVV